MKSATGTPASPEMQARAALRKRLVAARMALPAEEHARLSARLEGHLAQLLEELAPAVIGFCWPMRAEFDARALVTRWLARGARAALPVIAQQAGVMHFREWRPQAVMDTDRLGICFPRSGATLAPEVLLMPLNAFDEHGYRIGYGGGYFDRVLAGTSAPAAAIGVGFELARVPAIAPAPWDRPCDYVVTEAGAWQRRAGALQPRNSR